MIKQKVRKAYITNDLTLRFKLTYMLDDLLIDLQQKKNENDNWTTIFSKKSKIDAETVLDEILLEFYETYLEKVKIEKYFTYLLDEKVTEGDEDNDIVVEFTLPDEEDSDDENENPYH